MKKILLFPVLAIILASCSTDNDGLATSDNEAVLMNTVKLSQDNDKSLYPSCFALSGHVTIDLSDGFTNPVINFSADVTGQTSSLKKAFTVKLELQPLSDCEDFYSDSGQAIVYTLPKTVQNPEVNKPVISLRQYQLPDTCYKWRFVVDGGVIGSEFNPYCLSYSPWYEAPLF